MQIDSPACDEKKLDNPVWNSLSEAHQRFSIDHNSIKFYRPDFCPFGGSRLPGNISAAIDAYSTICDDFYIVGEKPRFSNQLRLKNELVCNQMVMNGKIEMDITEQIVTLMEEQSYELFQLINLVQPGYFKGKTFELGHYYGIFKENQLIAVTGERMQMYNAIEVSAVVTHPNHTGKGYAKQLVAYSTNRIINQGKLPFLHVAETNTAAIQLYERLGFKTRRKISFWNLVRL